MDLSLRLHNDSPASEPHFNNIEKHDLLPRLKALASRSERKGIESLDPSRNHLIAIGMEIDEAKNRVKKDCYGVFSLAWQAAQHPEWAEEIGLELETIRRAIRLTHGAPLRFLIWAGMGGSSEDKNMYVAAGLLSRGPRCYVLDSADPGKLKHILLDMEKRSGLPVATLLRRTLVVGMAMGMTSYEPVVNLEHLAKLYDLHGVDSRPNFIYMTLPGSLLDQFASARGYRRIELQPDRRNSVAGRHSSPLTRGSLYPLGLCGVDLGAWLHATDLSRESIAVAWRLAAFLHAQIGAGRDKVTLILPKAWSGAGLWTKQDFEESLGKSEQWGVKIVIGERLKLLNYRPPRDAAQDRVFLAVQQRGVPVADTQKIALLRRTGYPCAVLTFPRDALSRYMQFIHYAVFGLAWLRDMNFVTQPGVELYKSIANRIHLEARKSGGIEKTAAWDEFFGSRPQAKWRGRLTLYYRGPGDGAQPAAPEIFGAMLRDARDRGVAEYAELTYFGDMRYSPGGKALRIKLARAAESLFRARLKMPVDLYEGPAMNHSYHEMVIGHGRCFSVILLCESAETVREVDYRADYHRAQFLATIRALEQRGRAVVGITLKNLEAATLEAVEEFFRQVVHHA